MAGDKLYSVRVGRVPGIYTTWAECQEQTKGFSHAEFKSFNTLAEVENYMAGSEPMEETSAPVTPQQLSTKRKSNEGVKTPNRTERAKRTPPKKRKGPSIPPTICLEAVVGGGPTEPLNEMYTLHFDGASKGNPGAAGSGALLMRGSTKVLEILVGGGPSQTNNVAEYHGLIEGLRAALGAGVEQLRVWGDSKLVVQQVHQRWKVNMAHLIPLCAEAQQLKKSFKSCELHHVERALNKDADSLANEAVKLREGEVCIRKL